MAMSAIISMLENGPATILEIKTALGVSDTTVRKQIRALLKKGRIVKSGSSRSGKRSVAALFALPGSETKTARSARVLVIAELEKAPGGLTLPQLVVRTGLKSSTVSVALSRLRPLVHVADYRRVNKDGIANGVWVLGEGEDAMRPKGLRGKQAANRANMMERNAFRARSGMLQGQIAALRSSLKRA